jgi:hypothetical protein
VEKSGDISTNSDLEENFSSTSGEKTFENTKRYFLSNFSTNTLFDSYDDLSSDDEEDILGLLKQSQEKITRK